MSAEHSFGANPASGQDGPRRSQSASAGIQANIVLTESGRSARVTVSEISRTGAKFEVSEWLPLPDMFVLLLRLTPSTTARRLVCRPVWQMFSAVGVKFVTPLSEEVLQAILASGGPVKEGNGDPAAGPDPLSG